MKIMIEKMGKEVRSRIRIMRSRADGEYIPVHTAGRLGIVLGRPDDDWRWQRLHEVMDIMVGAFEKRLK